MTQAAKQQHTASQLDAFRDIVRSRRSIRRFTDEPIPDDVVEDCLDLAMLAPNSSNLQPWSFYVVKSPALKEQLAHACLGQNAARTAPVLIAIVARTGTWRAHSQQVLDNWPEPEVPKIVKSYYSKIAPIHYNQGPFGLYGVAKRAMGMVAGLRRPVPRWPYSPSAMKVWAAKSTALAAENLMLALRAHGYDSCPMEGFDSRRVNKLLSIPKDGEVIMILAAGRRAEKGVYGPQYRLDKSELVTWL